MADEIPSQLIEKQGRDKAREILHSMAGHRIDSNRINLGGRAQHARSARSVVTIAELAPNEGSPRPEFGQTVAVKKLHWDHEDAESSANFFKAFVYELSLMTTVSHPNVLKLIGFVDDMGAGDARMVLPWEVNGNIKEFLESGEWDIPERVSLIKEAVKGLHYLHTREPPICHGDLKSSHILVNSSFSAVITGFGSARIRRSAGAVNEDDPQRRPRQVVTSDVTERSTSPIPESDLSILELALGIPIYTLRWAAPEVMNNGVQDLPSDMWALGWICWEIVTGRIPFENLDRDVPITARVIKTKLPAIREEASLSQVLPLCDLMSGCWLFDPVERVNVSSFNRKVHFVPSVTPSGATTGVLKTRSADHLLELGRMYALQNNTRLAESHYQSAADVASRAKDDTAEANALIGLGEVYAVLSRYSEAEEAFKVSYEVHSLIGSDLGAAHALIGLGNIHETLSKYSEAERAFGEAHEIHCRIGNEAGAANALIGLGDIYAAHSKYSEAEKAFGEAHKIHSRIGNDLGAANALIGLGRIYNAWSSYTKAEKAFRDACDTHRRIGNELGSANALIGLGEIDIARSKYSEAEKTFREAHEIHSLTGNELGAANAMIGLGEIYNARSNYSWAEKAFKGAHEIHSRIGCELGVANVLIGLGKIYTARSSHFEAEEAFSDAYDIHRRIGNELGTAKALISLGELDNARSRYSDAERACQGAQEVYSRIGNDLGAANALIVMGHIWNARSRYSESERAFKEAYEIHYRIGNELGVASALIGLGETYDGQSKYSESEKALKEAYGMYSRICNEDGTAAALNSLGEFYNARSRYSEAENAFLDARKIHSHTGNQIRAAGTVVLLGETYNTQLLYPKADDAFKEALAILSSVEEKFAPGDAPKTLRNDYDGQSSYSRDGEAQEFDSRVEPYATSAEAPEEPGYTHQFPISTDPEVLVHEPIQTVEKAESKEKQKPQIRIAEEAESAGQGVEELWRSPSLDDGFEVRFSGLYPSEDSSSLDLANVKDKALIRPTEKAWPTIDDVLDIVRKHGKEPLEVSLNELQQRSTDRMQATVGTKAISVLSTSANKTTQISSPGPSPPFNVSQFPATIHATNDSRHFPTRSESNWGRTDENTSFPQVASVADALPNDRQEPLLSEELTTVAQVSASATEELVGLLQALGEAAPKAVRNKHKIYSILRVSRDIYNRIIEIGDLHEHQNDSNIQTLLTRMEHYSALLDALEEILLQLAAILPSEITAFGVELYSSWSCSRSTLDEILSKLCRAPFSTISSHAQDIANDVFFDDCSWLSRLLYSGIYPEISSQFLDVPKAHPVFAVISGLEYLETQVKCRVPDERTRKLIIDITNLLAQTLASTSPEDDDDEFIQEKSSLFTEADRDRLVRALANSFSILDLDSTLKPSTAKELATKLANIQNRFTPHSPGHT